MVKDAIFDEHDVLKELDIIKNTEKAPKDMNHFKQKFKKLLTTII